MNVNENALIQVQDLKKSFGTQVVLDGITTEIDQGEVVAIIGPSGCGKSTFLRSLNLLEEPTSGTILFEGTDITDKSVDINKMRQKIGMVFQQFNLFPNYTIQNNITLAPVKLGLMTQQEAEKKAKELLERVGLPERANDYPSQLSGGQKQRIAIARAILHDPKIIILDEATASLDTQTEKQIQDALGKLTKGRTTIAIAHRLSTLSNADRLIVLDKGRLAEFGTHAELMQKKGVYYKLVMAQRQTTKMKKAQPQTC